MTAALETPKPRRSLMPWTHKVLTYDRSCHIRVSPHEQWLRYVLTSPSGAAGAVRNKCAELMQMADDAAVTLRNEYAIQLLKLPKKVYLLSSSCLRMLHGRSCHTVLRVLLLLVLQAVVEHRNGTCRCAACRCCSSSSSMRATLRQHCWRG